jgi:hypothetical protein
MIALLAASHPLQYHADFWLFAGAASPVIALAAVVAMPDSTKRVAQTVMLVSDTNLAAVATGLRTSRNARRKAASLALSALALLVLLADLLLQTDVLINAAAALYRHTDFGQVLDVTQYLAYGLLLLLVGLVLAGIADVFAGLTLATPARPRKRDAALQARLKRSMLRRGR